MPAIRDYQSFSSMNTFMRCGLQYMFRYVEGIKTPPAVAMITGSAGHKGLETNYSQKIESHTDLPLADVLDATSTDFDSRVEGIEDWEDTTPSKAKDVLIKIMGIAHKTHCPNIQPVEVEGSYLVDVAGTKMKSYIDLIDDQGIVRDNKFVKRTKSQADTDNDLQLTLYSYITKKPNVAFDCLVKKLKPEVKTVHSRRDGVQWRRLELMIPRIITGIEQGTFLPADPTGWACSEKFCGYWNICDQGGKNVGSVTVDMAQNTSPDLAWEATDKTATANNIEDYL